VKPTPSTPPQLMTLKLRPLAQAMSRAGLLHPWIPAGFGWRWVRDATGNAVLVIAGMR
jgi:hypothetical protein